jgi:hypothetical protein
MKTCITCLCLLALSMPCIAQDSTRKYADRTGGAGFYYGANNNKWDQINLFLAANRLDGKFNSQSYYAWGWGIVAMRKKHGFEMNVMFDGQQFAFNQRAYGCTIGTFALLWRYYLYKTRSFGALLYAGLGVEGMRLGVDTLNSLTGPHNFTSSLVRKRSLYMPAGLDVCYKFGKPDKYKRKPFATGIRAGANILLYEEDWYPYGSSPARLGQPLYYQTLFFFLFGGY